MALLVVVSIIISNFTLNNSLYVQAADYSTAVNYPLNSSWSGDYYFTQESNENWYKFTMKEDGYVDFKVMTYFNIIRFVLYTEDLSSQIITSEKWSNGTVTAPVTSSYGTVLAKGNYYIKMTGDLGKYRLYGQFTEYYGNNDQNAKSYDSPQDISLGQVITGAMLPNATEDWYRIDLPSDGYYVIFIKTYFNIRTIKIFNKDLSVTAFQNESWTHGTSTAPITTTYDQVISKGIHYIKLTGDLGKYQLSISKITQDNCTHEFEDVVTDSTYAAKGYTTHTCRKCGLKKIDSYTDKLVLGVPSFNNNYCKGNKKKIKVSWYGVNDASGYQIQYSKKSNMKGAKSVNASASSNAKIIKKLSKKKKYYLRIRAYVVQDGKKVYSNWSKKIKIKTK